MKINVYIGIILLLILFLIVPTISLFMLKNNRKTLKIIAIISFVLYLIALFILVFGRVVIKNNVVEISLVTNNKWFSLHFIFSSFHIRNLLYNLVMFFPLSAFIFAISDKSTLIKTIIVAICLSCFIEIMQFILPVSRTTELFDIVTNTISALIGYVYFSLIIKLRDRYKKSK